MTFDEDIRKMHEKFETLEKVELMDGETLKKFVQFRINFIEEELDELKSAYETLLLCDDNLKQTYRSEIVDALVDIIVVSLGTIDLLRISPYAAWSEVMDANMLKVPGFNSKRPNPFGLPDLIKPWNWQAPDHKKNVGLLEKIK